MHCKKRGVNKRTLDPLREKTGITNHSHSKRCQKLMTDFGVEESFQMAVARMKDHHGVDLNVSAVRNITEYHAERAKNLIAALPPEEKPCKQMVMELDGEMVPLVEYAECKDRRKNKKNLWAELRIGVAQRHGEVSWKYAASFKNPDHLGDRMRAVMEKMGMKENTDVHGVGDGARWITEQGERVAGCKYSHLIDLFHLCDYFAAAVTAWTTSSESEVRRLKNLCEQGCIAEVQQELKSRQRQTPEHEGLKACIQYIENRSGQFEYKVAKDRGLPIGSGKVESSHRSLMQRRLKKPGTWWLRENAEKIADLRTVRANGCWALLWQQDFQGIQHRNAA